VLVAVGAGPLLGPAPADTNTGVKACCVPELTPSCPDEFSPQHCTPPESKTAHEWEAPVTTRLTPDSRPETWAGEYEFAVEPFPSCPLLPLPQHLAAPEATPQAWLEL
jgi:hypothetical protein